MTRTSTEHSHPEAAAGTEATGTTSPPTSDPQPLRGYAARLRLLRTIGLRVLGALIVLWGAATTAFLAQVVQPGDRATTILNLRSGQMQERTAAETAPINAEYGFDQPILTQYLHYLAGLLRGDLGSRSTRSHGLKSTNKVSLSLLLLCCNTIRKSLLFTLVC